jgi:class 3 adenylate cyclase
VEVRGGTLIEVRGDEALAVFDSARQAIRAAMDLQQQFAEETDADPELPLRVGIGIDSGEAIGLEDGSFRGASLNVAARLCALAHGGEILVSQGTSHLAGPGQPGGRNLCYFDGNDAVIVWTHERREQPSHRDMLAIAREGGSDHARLAAWWDVQHHLIGKIE